MRVDAEYLTNTGTVLVDALAELELANASTIDGGVITNHGELEATAGSNTIKNVTGANFTNTGIIEVVAGIGTVTLLLDRDILTNFTGSGPSLVQGTVLVDATGVLDLGTSTIDQGIVNNYGLIQGISGGSFITSATINNFGSG